MKRYAWVKSPDDVVTLVVEYLKGYNTPFDDIIQVVLNEVLKYKSKYFRPTYSIYNKEIQYMIPIPDKITGRFKYAKIRITEESILIGYDSYSKTYDWASYTTFDTIYQEFFDEYLKLKQTTQ